MTDTHNPYDFLKCPDCHRSTTVELTVHVDGDASIDCRACGAHASVFKLHEHDRTYSNRGVESQ